MADYSTYLLLLLHRVLSSIKQIQMTPSGEFHFAEMMGSVSEANQITTLKLAERKLVIVPTICAEHSEMLFNADGSGRVLVSCLDGTTRDDQKDGRPVQDGGAGLVINPFDFYGEEKIRIVVERFLWTPVYASYAASLDRLPEHALRWLGEQSIGKQSARRWRLVEPLDSVNKEKVIDWLGKVGLNGETQAAIKITIDNLEALSICRHCGKPGSRFTPRDDAFMATCDDCITEWGIYRGDTQRVARMNPRGIQSGDLRRLGSWFVDFAIQS